MARALRYTMAVRHPETLLATPLLAGSEVPEWAADFVSDDDTTDGKATPVVEVAEVQPEEHASPEPEHSSRPDKAWTNADIKQYAEDNGIDLGGATTKDDMLAVLDAS